MSPRVLQLGAVIGIVWDRCARASIGHGGKGNSAIFPISRVGQRNVRRVHIPPAAHLTLLGPLPLATLRRPVSVGYDNGTGDATADRRQGAAHANLTAEDARNRCTFTSFLSDGCPRSLLIRSHRHSGQLLGQPARLVALQELRPVGSGGACECRAFPLFRQCVGDNGIALLRASRTVTPGDDQ
jgi:hypothetical protein